ncbi:MAG: hypothetical protein K1X74_02725 [Pirellulales bacterium]|nr:hypothetical protein [Pirellulales bacterium]
MTDSFHDHDLPDDSWFDDVRLPNPGGPPVPEPKPKQPWTFTCAQLLGATTAIAVLITCSGLFNVRACRGATRSARLEQLKRLQLIEQQLAETNALPDAAAAHAGLASAPEHTDP